MAEPPSDDWFVGEDGSLAMGEPIRLLTYHSSLNILLVATKDNKLRVIDVTSGSVLRCSDLSASKIADGVQCMYMPGQDTLLFSNGYAVGVRADLNGVMLLDTALQTPVAQTEDVVRVELPLPDASQLFKSLMSAELAGVDHVEDVLRELESEIEAAQAATKNNHKVAKWTTVCLKLPYFTLRTVCSSLLVELKRLHQNVPGLSVASAVIDRLMYLLPANQDNAYSSTERSLMYSEAARRETFAKWPHMNYKWALPEPMAKAGFYHQPNSTGDDRAMCFTCNVCLVCWEPTDEPWSEHERHSSACPFVKGEYSQNVPLSVTHATEPAHPHGDNKTDKIACISTSANCDYFATSTLHGNVVIWDSATILKRHIQFNIEPSEPIVTSSVFTLASGSSDQHNPNTHKPSNHSSHPTSTHSNGPHVTENCINMVDVNMSDSCSSADSASSQESVIDSVTWTTQSGNQGTIKELSNGPVEPMDIVYVSDGETEQHPAGFLYCCDETAGSTGGGGTKVASAPTTGNLSVHMYQDSMSTGSMPSSAVGAKLSATDTEKEAKIGQVSGQGGKMAIDIEGIIEMKSPSPTILSNHQDAPAERHRPSRDVIVGSLCVLGPSKSGSSQASSSPKTHPTLITGVLIRMEQHLSHNNSLLSRTCWTSAADDKNEVQTLNQVNQALSEETIPEIISEGPSTSSSATSSLPRSNNFVPYLLVHNITKVPKPEPVKKDTGSKSILAKNLKEGKSLSKDIAAKLWPAKDEPKQNALSEKPGLGGKSVVTSPSSVSSGSSSTAKEAKEASKNSTNRPSDLPSPSLREGGILQCIPLPAQVGNNQYVQSITPTTDGRHVVVVTAPKCTNKKLSLFQPEDDEMVSSSEGDRLEQSMDEDGEVCVASQGGVILIYRVKQGSSWVMLEDVPCRTCVVDNLCDAVISLSVLPVELGNGAELPPETKPPLETNGNVGSSHTNEQRVCGDIVQGYAVLSLNSGQAKIIDLNSLATLGTIAPPEGDKIVSATFCTGIDRLCCCGESGRLYFYLVGPQRLHMEDLALGLEPAGWLSKAGTSNGTEDQPDSSTTETACKPDALLAHQPLRADTLRDLHELTQFENLVPRFSATVPPCWSEIQQEQQQRRHPQHLQQQGDSTQHTRTWRLQQDSTSADEHLFEVVIPKSCCVGHIDIKFSLHPLCASAPQIQVTLLRQSMSKLSRVLDVDPPSASQSHPSSPKEGKDVDTKIDFKLQSGVVENGPRNPSITDEDKADQSAEPAPSTSAQPSEPRVEPVPGNPVLSKEFLERHGAEVLCGPVNMSHFVDLSGHGGIMTLTGPELLKIKSRSFLVHFKAIPGTGPEKHKKGNKSDVSKSSHRHEDKERASTSASKLSKSKSISKKNKDHSGLPYLSSQDRLTALTSKQKLDSIRGCDWLQELSITIRRCKPVSIPRERLQRVTMLEDQTLHENLLKLVCGQEEGDQTPPLGRHPHLNQSGVAKSLGLEQRRILALDILTWICSILTHATSKSREPAGILLTTETHLRPLVRSCFIEANRTIAHQCTKFLTSLIEYSRSMDAFSHYAADFSYNLLTAFLESLALVPTVQSAGALHWYFAVLNRIKGMDIGLTGAKCVEMLSAVTKCYNERNNPLHALLKSRFGLYGHPLEPDLFDVDPPVLGKSTSQVSMSFANILKSNNNNNNGGTGTAASSPVGGTDEVDIQDYLLLSSMEKGGGSSSKPPDHVSNHIFGLLEVEPLHFTCHAASDGTRLERMDAGPVGPVSGTTSGVAGLSGTINFGGENLAPGGPTSMSSLSGVTEHQLSVLHQKHIQLLKLQQQKQKLEQKLAETSKGTGSVVVGSSVYNNPELYPPTPKNTPFFMTPPVTPPNESYHNIYVGGPADPGKPPTGKEKSGETKPGHLKSSFFWSQTQHLFQPMPPQALVIERLHSGARRFVVLDFGKPVLLTDIVVPGCGDLQSLSIDIWSQGEDVDGQRLVVAGDIGLRSLVLSDLCPPPLCRYLKITTIGRNTGNSSRSKIPLGFFYGHSFVFPWQSNIISHPLAPSSAPSPTNEEPESSSSLNQSDEQSQVMSQLGLCMSLHEDIHCRYSLACNRLKSLLSLVQVPHNSVDHTLYYLKQGKKSEDDKRVLQAYNDCTSLQLQLNLAQWAIDRLQGMLGVRPLTPTSPTNPTLLLKQASTDKLRILSEFLLNTLLSMTCVVPTIPQVPTSLYVAFTPQLCESLFRHLCLTGTKKIQIHTGVLLVRLCGNQPWWGEFLGNMIQEYFTSEQPLVFPRDRVFLVLCALGQKALSGPNASRVLESLVSLLGKLLSPLLTYGTRQHTRTVPGIVDQSLISWLLLFLSRSLDNTTTGTSDENADKTSATASKDKEKDTSTSRWDFLQGESSLQKKGGATRSRKTYHSRQRRGCWHPKYQLQMQHLNKEMFSHQANKALSTVYASPKPESYKLEALSKTHHLIKKQYKQYSSKHFKDMLNIRRTTGEYLRRLAKEDSSAGGGGAEGDLVDGDGDVHLTLSRDKCLPIVRGLVALLLSTDSTCHMDLFIVACKVLARVASITRPAMMLSEVFSQSELDELMLLTCNAQYNHGNICWGGSWAGHTIGCLLQDILDGERQLGLAAEGVVVDDEVSASVVSETDDSLQNSTTLPTIDEDNTTATTDPEISQNLENNNNTAAMDQSKMFPDEIPDNSDLQMILMTMEEMGGGKMGNKSSSSFMDILSNSVGEMLPLSQSPLGLNMTFPNCPLKFNTKKLGQQYGIKMTPVSPHGVSTAMDARLEHGVQLPIELRLKMMLSLETENIQTALTTPIPPLPGMATQPASLAQTQPTTDDEQLSEASLLSSLNQQQVVPSVEMLSTCFNALFCHRVNMESLLLLWLTLNEETTLEENGVVTFDSSRVPSIPLNEAAVGSLLSYLCRAPHVPIRTWVLAFQCLTLLANLKHSGRRDVDEGTSQGVGGDRWLAHAMLTDANLMSVFLKFLTGSAIPGHAISQQNTQVGPTAVKAFHELLVRLQLRCADDSENMLRELLLRLIYQLSTERGALGIGIGPLDAQCRLLDHMLEQSYQNVDINNAISVIESVSFLVHQHILSQSQTDCRSASESGISARSCFGGLFTQVVQAGKSQVMTRDASRDMLMCNLLSLVNLLVQVLVPQRAPRRNTVASVSGMAEAETRDEGAAAMAVDSPMTDFSKISQSLGGASIMTSTPNVPMSDDEKGAETDEQKTEHAVPAPKNPAGLKRERQSCTHFWDVNNPDADTKDATLSDFVLGHEHIMFHLLQALGACNSNAIATILGSSGNINDSFLGLDPVSVGDGIFQIMCTMNRKATDLSLVLRPLFQYISMRVPSGLSTSVCQLSEPLLWFILTVLDCERAFRTFIDMGGVEVVCNNLVRSTRDVISTSPGLVSTIMQYLGGAKGKNSAPRKISTDGDNGENLQNFAPLGTVSSSSPSAGPADVLIQGTAPHRRARSAAWSFNFYPHEAWVDLTISLPCAVLLKEVHIQPHLASLATCPSAVTLEVSRDSSSHVPITTPLVTSGLNSIKVTLQRPEVVTAVTLRLHKPRDSSTIGLSQIKVLGSTAFGDGVTHKSSGGAGEDYVARTSMGWLRLLHHCLTHCQGIQDLVAQAAAPVTPLLTTCTSLLLSSGVSLYLNNIEAVLLRLGLHSAEMGLALIDQLLRNIQGSSAEQGLGGFGKTTAVASESTVDLLYQLGVSQDDSTTVRVKSMVDWLGDSARIGLQKAHSGPPEGYLPRPGGPPELPSPAPAHVHCVAAILWASQDRNVRYNLPDIVSRDVLSSMYEWSMALVPDSALKKAVDAVICSICYIHPEYFTTLLEWMAIVVNVDFNRAFLTDDHKDNQQQQQQQNQPQEAMTDDLKATSEAHRNLNLAARSASGFQPVMLQEFGHMMLDESHLSTLAIACQSPLALRQLLDTGFLAVLCQGLYEFCLREMSRWGEPVILSELFTESGRGSSGPTSPRSAAHLRGGSTRRRDSAETTQDQPFEAHMLISADLVGPVLRFLTEISREVDVKDWLGGPEGCVFWPVLLRLLCSAPVPVAHSDPTHTSKYRAMSVQQRSAIETSTIDFFSCVLSCHQGNQLQFANILCDVIRGQGSTVDEYGYRSSPLCGFMRCLFLQVLLEDEKVWVCLKASSQLYKGHSNALTALVQHPRFGAGHRYRVVQMSLQSSCTDIMGKVSDTPSLATQTAQLLEENGDKTLADDLLIDSNELGIEVVAEQISAAAGLQAKQKRDEKANKGSSPSRPPRPPSRRGHCPSEALGAMNIPVLMLYHRLLPGQPLPADLTLSQLLVMLQERGLAEGQAYIDFTLKFKSKPLSMAAAAYKADTQSNMDVDRAYSDSENETETIPESLLLETPSLPTALQVFAGVGGLALLAEHLPLLYPEVTRQGPPLDGDKPPSGSGNATQDWVTVENSEDIYEEIYEPIPPNQSSTGPKQALSVLPSIPPHSLVAFGLFLRLPGYAEVLLKEKRKAQCLLRLVLGVTDDGEGGHILTSPIASSLPTLPFNVLKQLFEGTPLSTDDGVLLRRMTLEIGAVHLVLACLSVLSHQAARQTIPGIHQEIILAATQAASAISNTQPPPSPPKPTTEERSQLYWAKGTGFGTGSTASYWDAEQALIRQRCEEEHVTCLLQVLSSFIHPGGDAVEKFEKMEAETEADPIPLPSTLPDLFSQSCLAPAICSYLRNDSVLDMARHVPLYRSLLELLRGLALCPLLVPLLLPLERDDDTATSISSLLDKMKVCVDTYASRLKTNKKVKPQREDEESEGLALLIPDIQATAGLVDTAIRRVRDKSAEMEVAEDEVDCALQGASKVDHSLEDKYMAVMRELQFDTFEIVVEEDGKLEFTVPHHYESNAKAAGEVNNASRARRLAQEAVTLSTSLPLSAGSSVFVRCDEERLDIMKVLITGPSDTPYENGCFEFDVYFPQDYPNTPPQINLETTGNHTVRFNPNLYNDGKVCLSILNTWHGRPEEKWNSQTSSFLQVLVSIQSLILVAEPYFNEPGYERSRGTASGTSCSKEYDANIRQATVKWAMLEMVRNPPACFKEVIENHFWMKQQDILRQVEGWITDLEANCSDKRVGRTITHSCVALKRHFAQLKEEFAKMKPPPGLADDDSVQPTAENHGDPTHSSEAPTAKSSMTKSETFTAGDSPLSPAGATTELQLPATTTQAIGNTAAGQSLSPLDLVEVANIQADGDDLIMYSSESDSEDVDIGNVDGQPSADDLLIGL